VGFRRALKRLPAARLAAPALNDRSVTPKTSNAGGADPTSGPVAPLPSDTANHQDPASEADFNPSGALPNAPIRIPQSERRGRWTRSEPEIDALWKAVLRIRSLAGRFLLFYEFLLVDEYNTIFVGGNPKRAALLPGKQGDDLLSDLSSIWRVH